MGVVVQQKSAARRGAGGGGAADPSTIFGANLVAWYDSEFVTLNGGDVSALLDQSSVGNDAVQATAARQPLYSAAGGLNGRSKITFDGVEEVLQTAGGASHTSPFEVFIVFDLVDKTVGFEAHIFSHEATNGLMTCTLRSAGGNFRFSNPSTRDGGSPDNDPHYGSFLYNAASSDFRLDGVSVVTGNPGTTAAIPVTLGSRPDLTSAFFSNHDLYHWSLIDRAATSGERTAMESYLADRYGL